MMVEIFIQSLLIAENLIQSLLAADAGMCTFYISVLVPIPPNIMPIFFQIKIFALAYKLQVVIYSLLRTLGPRLPKQAPHINCVGCACVCVCVVLLACCTI